MYLGNKQALPGGCNRNYFLHCQLWFLKGKLVDRRADSFGCYCQVATTCCFFLLLVTALLANGLSLLGLSLMILNIYYEPLEFCICHISILLLGDPSRRLREEHIFPPCKIWWFNFNPVQLSSLEYDASTKVTGPLQSLLLSQSGVCSDDVRRISCP